MNGINVVDDFLAVIAMTSKSGGKNGKHCDITESSTIAAISLLSIQVFQQDHSCYFHSIPENTSPASTL